MISVAISSVPSFNPAKQVDKHSLEFGPEGDTKADNDASASGAVTSEDVNKDGLTDLVSHYNIDKIGFSTGTSNACLKAETEDDQNGEQCQLWDATV